MTGEELREIQRRARLSNRAILAQLGFQDTPAANRRLRRWKAGSEAVPDNVAALALGLIDRHA